MKTRTTYDAAGEVRGKERTRKNVVGKKPGSNKAVLDHCDEMEDLKKKGYEAEGGKAYREANKRIQKAVKKTKEDWKLFKVRRWKLP